MTSPTWAREGAKPSRGDDTRGARTGAGVKSLPSVPHPRPLGPGFLPPSASLEVESRSLRGGASGETLQAALGGLEA